MSLLTEVGGAVIAALIAAFLFYLIAHTWVVRPLIGLVERLVGRRFFPFLDRVFPPRTRW